MSGKANVTYVGRKTLDIGRLTLDFQPLVALPEVIRALPQSVSRLGNLLTNRRYIDILLISVIRLVISVTDIAVRRLFELVILVCFWFWHEQIIAT